MIVFCTDGNASSLAARDLERIGLRNATDLIGEGGSQAITSPTIALARSSRSGSSMLCPSRCFA